MPKQKTTKKPKTHIKLVLEGNVFVEEYSGKKVILKDPIDGKLVLKVLLRAIEEGVERYLIDNSLAK